MSTNSFELWSMASNTEVTPLNISNGLRVQSKTLAALTAEIIDERISDLNKKVAAEKEVGWWSRGTNAKIDMKAEIRDLNKSKKEIKGLQKKLDKSKADIAGIKDVESISQKIKEKTQLLFNEVISPNENADILDERNPLNVLNIFSSNVNQLHNVLKEENTNAFRSVESEVNKLKELLDKNKGARELLNKPYAEFVGRYNTLNEKKQDIISKKQKAKTFSDFIQIKLLLDAALTEAQAIRFIGNKLTEDHSFLNQAMENLEGISSAPAAAKKALKDFLKSRASFMNVQTDRRGKSYNNQLLKLKEEIDALKDTYDRSDYLKTWVFQEHQFQIDKQQRNLKRADINDKKNNYKTLIKNLDKAENAGDRSQAFSDFLFKGQKLETSRSQRIPLQTKIDSKRKSSMIEQDPYQSRF